MDQLGKRRKSSQRSSKGFIKPAAKNSKREHDRGNNTGDGVPSDARDGCCFQGKFFCDALKAIISRQLFLFHALLAIFRVSVVSRNSKYWLMSLTFVFVAAETLVILIHRRGQEWKWFQPSVFLYLLSVCPPIWLLELEYLGFMSFVQQTANATIIPDDSFPWIELDRQEWLRALEQILLVLVILNRWIIPKGDLTRDELSQLLISHLGTASDIADFFSILSEPGVRNNEGFAYVVLFVWTLSLMQFSIVSSAKRDVELNDDEEFDEDTPEDSAQRGGQRVQIDECAIAVPINIDKEATQRNIKMKATYWYRIRLFGIISLETEAWAILFSLAMQDGPYLVVRVVTIFGYQWITYTNCFFAVKNALFLVLQCYRITSLYIEQKAERDERLKTKKDMLLVKVQFLDYPNPQKWNKDSNRIYDSKFFKF